MLTDKRESETGNAGADFRNEAYAYIAASITYLDFKDPNSFFGALGRGNWLSCAEGIIEGVSWSSQPWEVAPPETRKATDEARLTMADPILPGADLRCPH